MQIMTEWGRGHVNPGVGKCRFVGQMLGRSSAVLPPLFGRLLRRTNNGVWNVREGVCYGGGLFFGRYDGGAADEVFLPVSEVEAYPACAAFFDGLEMVVGAGSDVEAGAGREVVEREVQ